MANHVVVLRPQHRGGLVVADAHRGILGRKWRDIRVEPMPPPNAGTARRLPTARPRERLVTFGPAARLPVERIIRPTVARPWIERIDDVLELRPELRHGPH